MAYEVPLYGTCPRCGAPGARRERRPNGNDTCINGHVYPSAKAVPTSTKSLDAHPTLAVVADDLPNFWLLFNAIGHVVQTYQREDWAKMFSTAKCPAVEYVPASKLAAAEAEIERLKLQLRLIGEKSQHNAGGCVEMSEPTKETIGKQVTDKPPYLLEPGEYTFRDTGIWYARTPDGRLANLGGHSVVEHEDRTISVSPSILVRGGDSDGEWHGFLIRGVWKECK